MFVQLSPGRRGRPVEGEAIPRGPVVSPRSILKKPAGSGRGEVVDDRELRRQKWEAIREKGKSENGGQKVSFDDSKEDESGSESSENVDSYSGSDEDEDDVEEVVDDEVSDDDGEGIPKGRWVTRIFWEKGQNGGTSVATSGDEEGFWNYWENEDRDGMTGRANGKMYSN